MARERRDFWCERANRSIIRSFRSLHHTHSHTLSRPVSPFNMSWFFSSPPPPPPPTAKRTPWWSFGPLDSDFLQEGLIDRVLVRSISAVSVVCRGGACIEAEHTQQPEAARTRDTRAQPPGDANTGRDQAVGQGIITRARTRHRPRLTLCVRVPSCALRKETRPVRACSPRSS